jgi:hypothetical protein
LKQRPGAADSLIKVQGERKFVQNVLEAALEEVQVEGLFQVSASMCRTNLPDQTGLILLAPRLQSLLATMAEESRKERSMAETILREKQVALTPRGGRHGGRPPLVPQAPRLTSSRAGSGSKTSGDRLNR